MPGLADAAATWVAFGDNAKGGEAYVAAAAQCDNPEAAVAAVGPLHAVDKCDEALAALRAAWPHVHGAKAKLGIDILDGVTACSDALTLRRNLAFVPTDVLQGYLSVVEERARQEREAQRRAEQQQRDQEARDRAWQASSQCRRSAARRCRRANRVVRETAAACRAARRSVTSVTRAAARTEEPCVKHS